MRKAVDLVVEEAKPISVDQAKARDKLWTPEKERDEAAGEIWTPGSARQWSVRQSSEKRSSGSPAARCRSGDALLELGGQAVRGAVEGAPVLELARP